MHDAVCGGDGGGGDGGGGHRTGNGVVGEAVELDGIRPIGPVAPEVAPD